MSKWDTRYLQLAYHVASWSKDPTTKVGAVIVGRRIGQIALGYNGLPSGLTDSSERLSNREVKHLLTQHAERNALDNAYFDVEGSTLYCTQIPCTVRGCSLSVVTKKIARVVCPRPPDKEPWKSDSTWSELVLAEAGIELTFLDVPKEEVGSAQG